MGAMNSGPSHGFLVIFVVVAVVITLGSIRAAHAQNEAAEDADVGEWLTVAVHTAESLHVTTRSYLSVTISSGQLRKGLIGYDFSSQRLKNIAVALAPADVRIGGTYSDYLHFDASSDESNCVDKKIHDEDLDFTMTGIRWDNLTTFCDEVGWDIMWDFNLLSHTFNNSWNSSAAKEFLDYSTSRGVRIPMFELGNEPNLYVRKFNKSVEAVDLAQDYLTLKDLIVEMPLYTASGLYGPSVNNLDMFSSSQKYLAQFLQGGACDVITEVALHHYYFKSSSVSLEDFMSLDVMETLRTELEFAYNISWANCRRKLPIRFTETSTSSGGGVDDISNAYVAGFLWLDKLGMSATYGITRVFRQTFLKSTYALVNKNLKPNPDYYLSVIYKRLVEGPVFQVYEEGLVPEVRIYAHCVGKSYYNYTDGALVLYYLSVSDEANMLSLSEFGSPDVDLFIFTPGDEFGLNSRLVKLNGVLLEIGRHEVDLPPMEPQRHSGDVLLAPKTFGFIVIPDADVQLCKDYHRFNNSKKVTC